MRVIVIGAGPAGVMAAMRAAELGAETTLVTRDEFGGMAANDGPIPVRTLAHGARLVREARLSLLPRFSRSTALEGKPFYSAIEGEAQVRSLCDEHEIHRKILALNMFNEAVAEDYERHIVERDSRLVPDTRIIAIGNSAVTWVLSNHRCLQT